jgi:two-component system response regulator PilR (NtrC family)
MRFADAPHLLVVDDEPDLRTLYELSLMRAGYRVDTVPDLQTAHEQLKQHRYDAVVTDMRLPDGSGLELVRLLAHRTERVLVITAYGSTDNAVEALKAGAFDYLTKPVEPRRLREAVGAALRQPQAPNHQVRGTHSLHQHGTSTALSRLIGSSPQLTGLRQRIERVARSMAPVMVLGESGTGKELVARALHDCSPRADGPFVAVNCGAIPENLLEAEFFGVRKGAFTGAHADRQGYFQAAHGGTLFLDEIGDLPLAMQAKLLRAIQERQVRPLGAAEEIALDVRLVSATHRDLVQLVGQALFRQDLFYRLHVIELNIPPLRERRQDLPELAHFLLERLARDSGQPAPQLSPDALAWLLDQNWPGNVRELENCLHRGLALNPSSLLDASDLKEPAGWAETALAEPTTVPATPATVRPHNTALDRDGMLSYLEASEREVLMATMKQHHDNVEAAAQALGMGTRQLSLRLRRLGMTAPHSHGN